MGRQAIVKPGSSVGEGADRRQSARLKQLKLPQIENGAREQKLPKDRYVAKERVKVVKRKSPPTVETISLDDDVDKNKGQVVKKLKREMEKWNKLPEVKKEEILKSFDLDQQYGPCRGISRTERLIRARQFGFVIPEDVKQLINSGNVELNYDICLWDRSPLGST